MADFTIYRGTDERLNLALVDALGAPINLTGVELWFTVKRFMSDLDADAIIQKTEVAGITVDDALGGLCHVDILPADTLATPWYRQRLHYDVKGHIGTRHEILARGTLTIEPTVTQAVAP